MKNPLREMSRPKAVAVAGAVAGAVAISGAAAALNVGLLSADESAPFTPQDVAATADGSVTTTSTTEPPVEIVYQDVYEQVRASTTTPAGAAPVGPTSTGSPPAASDDSHDDAPDHDPVDSDDGFEDEDETEDDEDEGEDHEEEDEEDDEFDD